MDLEAAGADRHLEPIPVAACFLEGLRYLRFAGPEEPQCPPERWRAPVEHATNRFRLERSRPQPLQLGRRSREHDDRRPARLDDEAGRRTCKPEDVCALGNGRLFRHPLREVCVRTLHPLSGEPRDTLDLSLELLVGPKWPARHLRDDLDGAVVVRRPETPRTGNEIGGGDSVAHGSLELGGLVAHDLDPCGLDPECEQRTGEERSVEIGPLAPYELTARDDDHGPWTRWRLAQLASAAKTFFAVTKTPCALTAGASFTLLPFSFASTFRGVSSRSHSTLPSNRWR